MTAPKRTAILISGRGSNMAALIKAAGAPGFPAEIVGVFSSNPEAAGLAAAGAAGLPAVARHPGDFASRAAFDAEIGKQLAGWNTELVCLAGFMRLLGGEFVASWAGRVINVHPSLLPAFPGLDTHARALAAGVAIHGATVHFVTPEIDAGPPIIQAAVPVAAGDTTKSLAARVLVAEHAIYPRALEWLAAGKVALNGNRVIRSGPEPTPPHPAVWPPLSD